MKLGHKYTVQRGRTWLRAMIVIGSLMILSLFLMLAKVAPPLFFLLVFLVYAVTAVLAVLDFAIPILQHIEEAQERSTQDGGLSPDARYMFSARVERCLVECEGRAIQPQAIADRISAPLIHTETVLNFMWEEGRVEPYGKSGCWKLPDPPKGEPA